MFLCSLSLLGSLLSEFAAFTELTEIVGLSLMSLLSVRPYAEDMPVQRQHQAERN